jgi:TonB family protein
MDVPMRTNLLKVVCLLSAAAAAATAQPRLDEKSAEKAFRDSLANQVLIIRGFSAEPEVDFQWTANGLESGKPQLRTLGAVEPVSVKVKHGQIEIKGTRETVVSDNNGTLQFSEGRPVVLVIDLGGVDPAIVLPQLKAALFYGNLDEALAAVPADYSGFLHIRSENPDARPRMRHRAGTGGAAACPADPSSFRQPKVVQSVDPEYSEEARKEKFSGNVMVGLTVDKDGNATDLWLVRPVGHGLDEQAAKAVRQYQFNPATCSGEPVATQLAIEVNFHIF